MSRYQRRRVQFTVEAEPGSDVFVAGTFNDWDPKARKLQETDEAGVFMTRILLPRGDYEYKFVVNDEWRMDSSCESWVPNEHGSLNSQIHVEPAR
jgi:1,4-alpha-glucan branching enzyme